MAPRPAQVALVITLGGALYAVAKTLQEGPYTISGAFAAMALLLLAVLLYSIKRTPRN